MDFDLCTGHYCGNITTSEGKQSILRLDERSHEKVLMDCFLSLS